MAYSIPGELKVCGQCGDPRYDDEYGCPDDNPDCTLALCGACCKPVVHFRDDGSCPDWWGESMTEEEVAERMRESAKKYCESMSL